MFPRILPLLAVCLVAPLLVHAGPDAPPRLAAAEEVDRLLADDWARHQLRPNPPAPDEVFLRRIYLDVIGRIPTGPEAEAFLSHKGEGKRAELIDRLLASDGYAHHMYTFWGDILRVQSVNHPPTGISSELYVAYVKESLRTNKPYDQFVRELVGADGKVWENGAIGYYLRDRGMPLENMALTARIFLGTRMECAQCHNHPFDKWTQMQFYHMAAFTYGMDANHPGIREMPKALALFNEAKQQRKARLNSSEPAVRAQAEREEREGRWVGKALDDLGDRVRYVKAHFDGRKELQLPHDYKYDDAAPKEVVKPATVLGGPAETSDTDRLPAAYARWMTSPENPRFTKVIANRLWKKAFGRGLIDPVDDLNDKSMAVNPELLAFLEKLMVGLRYDLKAYLRVLYNTRAYQADVSPQEVGPGDEYHFTGPVLRRMTAEQIWDSCVALINPEPDRKLPLDREVQVKTGQTRKISDALDLLTGEELYEGALKASRVYETTSERANELKDQFAAAQKAKDKELMSKLNDEIRAQSMIGRSAANEALVVPAVARLYTEVTGQKAPPPPAANDAAAMMGGKGKGKQLHNYITVPGYDVPEEDASSRAARTEQFREEARRLHVTDEERYLKAREMQERTWLRAAELPSPAPRGHFLRDFGQSDRDVIENASSEASVPQALALMNGELLPELTDPNSQLMLTLSRAKTLEARIDAAYLALFTRHPTAAERERWSQAGAQGLNSAEDIVAALINTQQFLFIQ